MNKHQWKKMIFLLLLLLMISVLGYKKISGVSTKQANIASEGAVDDLGVPIEITEVKKEKLTEKISYIGTIYPRDTVEVSSKVSAEILAMEVQEGDFVKKGQVIAKLEDAHIVSKLNTTQAKIDTMEFNLQYLKKEEEKYGILFEEGVISEGAYDKIKHEGGMVEMQLKELYALKDELAVNLKDTLLTAPISGVVKKIHYSVGDLAVMGKPIAVIDDVSALLVKVNVAESDLAKIREGIPVFLTILGMEDKVAATVTKIMPSLNPKTRIGEIEIGSIKLEENVQVMVGSSVETEFIINEINEAHVIAADAVKQLTDRAVVYKVEKDAVSEVPIKTGMRMGDKIQVIEGLKEGDKIAIKNMDKLYEGAKVYIFKGEDS